MNLSNFGAVRRALYASAVLTLFAVPSGAQVVEKGRTLADLIASHPCDTGLTNRIARVTDCDAADDFGNGGGAFQCWAYCDGSAPWTNLAIGGGAGVSGLTTADGGDAIADNCVVRGDGTEGIQCGPVTLGDVASNLIPVTASTGNAFNFTGSTNTPFRVTGNAGATVVLGALDATAGAIWLGEPTTPSNDYTLYSDGTNVVLNVPSTSGILALWRHEQNLMATLQPGEMLLSSGGHLLSYVKVITSTEGVGAPYALPATDSGTLTTNEGSTALNYQVLPSAATGMVREVCVQDSDGLRLVANTGDTIRRVASVTTSGGYIESTTRGSCATLKAINSTEWFITSTNDLALDSWSFN